MAAKHPRRGSTARSGPRGPRWRRGIQVGCSETHREAVQKLFPQSDVWDLPETNGNGTESRSGSQSEADDTVPLEDPHAALLPWDTE